MALVVQPTLHRDIDGRLTEREETLGMIDPHQSVKPVNG
jgi:hypothetical protein